MRSRDRIKICDAVLFENQIDFDNIFNLGAVTPS